MEPTPCIGGDPTCPCQDGDACHYKAYEAIPDFPATDAFPTERQGVQP
jgi:hypothetical protein